ncbi:peptidase family M28-domain-containing protein [Lipomyces tetrasporus]|uniref:Peptide hydrolase n=1 Tax=Lipomyces tetrasporus TaxID=54092 RepID=A0AAD7QWE9_9ASCO|nr:peptidase family M28-domain-containing protein [Lipomyces tetrasporus]KAJ8101042.1 peptidase family M28-domain-containing protein [Lipomyces tetrasporus]
MRLRLPNISGLLKLLALSALVSCLPSQRRQLTDFQLSALIDSHPPLPALSPNYYTKTTTASSRSAQSSSGASNGQNNNNPAALLTPILIPRTPGSENATIVRNHFTTHFDALSNWTAVTDAFTATVPEYGGVMGMLNFTNLIFRLTPPGSDDMPSRYLTLVAHYDSKISPFGFIGATDSAAPCAILMYLAETLTPYILARWKADISAAADDTGLQIIFMDGEEALVEWSDKDSLYGARHLAELWEAERRPSQFGRLSVLQDIDLFVLLDLLGADSPSVPCFFEITSWACRDIAETEATARNAGLAKTKGRKPFVQSDNVMQNVFIDDDHMPFLTRGTPVVHVIPIPFPTVWHTMDDDGAHLSSDAVHDWAVIVTGWVAGYLGLGDFIA